MRRTLPAALVVVAAVVTPAATAAHGAGSSCLSDNETRNSWHHLPLPVTGAHVATDSDDPCVMTAVADDGRSWSTSTGGASWKAGGTIPVHIRAVYRAGLPNDIAIAIPSGQGLYVTNNNGKSWTAATGLTSVTISALTSEPDNREGVWAAGAHTSPVGSVSAPSGSVFSSTDAGSTWVEDARALPIQPTVVARIGAPYDAVFANDTHTDNLWERTDTGSFQPVYSDAVHDEAVGPLKGGGYELYAAGNAGVAVTRDGGTTFSVLTSKAATSIAPEFNHYTSFMYVSKGTVFRSTNTGHTSRAISTGMPGDCNPTSLVGDHGDPTTFLATCGDGSIYRYRSDGSDLSDADAVTQNSQQPSSFLPTPIIPQPMVILGTRNLPNGAGYSASIAFDGTYLYYATSDQRGVLHRIVAATGTAAPDLHLQLKIPVTVMTYDPKRHFMYVNDGEGHNRIITLRTGAVSAPIFSCKSCAAASYSEPMTFDASSDQFIFTYDHADTLQFVSRAGRVIRGCTIVSQTVTAPGENNTSGTPQLAGIVATGDGGVYAEDEDDSTVYRLDTSCHITNEYEHAPVSEAPDENDALACDTLTFSQPAIWIRDAQAGTATAYAVPDGYCALSTLLTVTAPARVITGHPGTVCAVLQRMGTREAIPHEPVQLFVANRLIGNETTDSSGRICASYSPTAEEAGRRSTTASTVSTHARQPIVGTFLGTIAFRPSSAHAEIAALDPGVPVVAPPPPAQLPPAPVAAVAPPVIVAPPAPPVPPAPQPQPLPQAHPGAQPGAAPLGQTGAAFQQESEAEAATAENSSDEFHARTPVSLPDLRIVLPVGLVVAAAVARKRRASRVRSQAS